MLPLDFFVAEPAQLMSPAAGDSLPQLGAEVHSLTQEVVSQHCPSVTLATLERFDFYDAAREPAAFASVGGSRSSVVGSILHQQISL